MILEQFQQLAVRHTYLHSSLLSRPSRPSVCRLQVTNTGARRPGYEATRTLPGSEIMFLGAIMYWINYPLPV